MPRLRPEAGRDATIVVVVLAVLGVLGGVLWSLVVTPAEFTKVAAGAAMGDDEVRRQFGADGWYVVIAVLTALVAGTVLSWWRSKDVVVTSAALVVGALLAAVAMAVTGHRLGPGDPTAALAAAKVGDTVPERLDVGLRPVRPLAPYLRDTTSVYLAWPVGALAGALVVVLGRRSVGDDGRGPREAASPEVGDSELGNGPRR